jgi:serine/threonine protein kinase
MLTRKVLFPGSHYIHQLNLIFEALGRPTQDDLDEIANESAKDYIKNLKFDQNRPIAFPENTDPSAMDLLRKLLMFSPSKRINISDALAHEYCAEYYARV